MRRGASPLWGVYSDAGAGPAVPIKEGNGATSSMELRVDRVKTRPSVSRTTGPRASLIRAQPMPPSTANSGTPPNRTDSACNRANRSALSRAVPPLLVPLHSSMARSAPASSKITKSGAGVTRTSNLSAISAWLWLPVRIKGTRCSVNIGSTASSIRSPRWVDVASRICRKAPP